MDVQPKGYGSILFNMPYMSKYRSIPDCSVGTKFKITGAIKIVFNQMPARTRQNKTFMDLVIYK